jgi:hypothetical protein
MKMHTGITVRPLYNGLKGGGGVGRVSVIAYVRYNRVKTYSGSTS